MRTQQRGMSITSLLVAVLIGGFLLAAVSQLFFYAKNLYVKTRAVTNLYDNAREAIHFLSQNVQLAGNGMVNPNPTIDFTVTGTIQIPKSEFYVTEVANPYGGHGTLPGWMYIGYFQDSVNRLFNQQAMQNNSVQPFSCAQNMDTLHAFSQFFGLQWANQCWFPNNAFFNKTVMTTASPANTGTQCGGFATPNNNAYNCGGSYQNAAYQKLLSHAQVQKGVGYNQSDTLIVRFQNLPIINTAKVATPIFYTFSGGALPAVSGISPVAVGVYTFSIQTVNNVPVLQVNDSTTGVTYNIVNNIEYMRVLLGESDTDSTLNNYYLVPSLNRYVEGNAPFLDLYRILSVRIAIVVRSTDAILTTPALPMKLMQGNDGAWITYTPPQDLFLRRSFVITIPLLGFRPAGYEKHCVQVGGAVYMKTGGIRFSNQWTSSDSCCKTAPNGNCRAYTSIDSCVQQSAGTTCW